MNTVSQKNPTHPLRKSFKMQTKNGFIVRYNRNGTYVCFFVDEHFNHRPWKLTIKNGAPLDQREYLRLKKEHNLFEQILSPHEIVMFGRIASIVAQDPFHGLTKKDRQNALSKKQPPEVVVKDVLKVDTGTIPKKSTKKGSLYERTITAGIDRFVHYLGVPENQTVEQRKEGTPLRVAYSTQAEKSTPNIFAEKLKRITIS